MVKKYLPKFVLMALRTSLGGTIDGFNVHNNVQVFVRWPLEAAPSRRCVRTADPRTADGARQTDGNWPPTCTTTRTRDTVRQFNRSAQSTWSE